LNHGNHIIYQDCPINYLPVYVKAGSLIAMQSDIMHTGEPHDGILRLHLYVGKNSSSYLHYEDDGVSLSYKNGQNLKRVINWDGEKEQVDFLPCEGNYESKFLKIKLFVHGNKSNTIKVNGKSLTIQNENVAFVDKLTDFDPLPDNSHVYLESKNVQYVLFDHDRKHLKVELN
jgi:alpha-glucosidase